MGTTWKRATRRAESIRLLCVSAGICDPSLCFSLGLVGSLLRHSLLLDLIGASIWDDLKIPLFSPLND